MERKSILRKNNKELLSEENGIVPIPKMSVWRSDGKNIILLFLLYTLQGIPLGLSASIPMILQNRGVTYKQQAEFSFVTWPFSLKLLWAPLVDSLYSSRVGRRKTWLIPMQYLIGIFMLFLSGHVDGWLAGPSPNIGMLTLVFFCLNFFAATQDIAVDGWALTMLQKTNVGHASTCNSVGQTAGFFLSYVIFMALESPDFCNEYIRSTPEATGVITLAGFLLFWGWVFIVTTTLVALLKREVEPVNLDVDHHAKRDIQAAYESLKDILSLRPIQILAAILLTAKIGYSSTDSVMTLKLAESGIPKERLGLMAIPLIPVQVILPLVVAKYTTGPKPLDIYVKAVPYRLLFGIIAAFLVWLTPILVPNPSRGLPYIYVIVLILCYALHQICVCCMFVSIMAFFAKVSDSSVGGTYMTLLNTLSNLGNNWPALVALYFVDPLTWRECKGGTEALDNLCRDLVEQDLCTSKGGKCETLLDGFYVETVICSIIGIVWLLIAKKKINYIQTLNESAWKLNKKLKR